MFNPLYHSYFNKAVSTEEKIKLLNNGRVDDLRGMVPFAEKIIN